MAVGRVTVALETVRRVFRPRRSYRELEGLEEISRAFEAMTDIRETYGRLTRRLAELVGCEKCVISLYEAETREFVCQWPGYNVADELLKKVRYPADALRPAWNFRHRGPMVNKRTEEFNEEQRAFLRPFGVYNLSEFPLLHEGRFVGKISIANKPGGLSENDVRLVTVFAAQVAVVIQNAHLYRRLQESAAQLEVKVQERTAELEATYRKLEASHARLREVDQLKSDFLGNVSHELRTPLAAVKGYVDNLLDGVAGPLADRPRHYLGRVRDNTDRLGRMVSDLLDLTRIEAGKIELIPRALPVADLLVDAVDGLRHLADERRIRLIVGPRGVPSRLGGSRSAAPGPDEPPGECDQVQPAGRPRRDHRPRGHRGARALRGRGHRPRDHARGAGARVRQVLPGRASRVGAPARHGPRPHHRPPPGRAPRRADLGGGRPARRGRVRHPAARRWRVRMMDSSGRLPPPADSPERLVLVVDDETDLLQIVTDRLAANGYRVVTARDGIEALARARDSRPGCIILDLKMPRLGGFEALPEIRQAAPQARVIVLTGSPNRPLREACRARGADEFMLKPFDPGELLRLTAQAFDRD